MAGQSQTVRQITVPTAYAGTLSSLGVAVSDFCGVYARTKDSAAGAQVDTPAWQAPSEGGLYKSTFAAEFLRRKVEKEGVAWAISGYAAGSTTIAYFAPGAEGDVRLRAVLDHIKAFEEFYWHQGGDDAGDGTTYAAYKTALTQVFSDAASQNQRGTNFKKAVTTMATRTSAGRGTTAQVQAIRTAGLDWSSENGAVYAEPHDIDLVDSVHQGQAGNIVLAHHVFRVFNGNDNGPTLGAGTRSGNTITIPVTLPAGATALAITGNPGSRFHVFPAGTTANAVAVSAVAYDEGEQAMKLTLAAAPANDVALDVYFCRHPDPSQSAYGSMIRDDRMEDGLPVGRNLEPATVNGVAAVAAPGGEEPAEPAPEPLPVGARILLNTYHSQRNASEPSFFAGSAAAGWNSLNARANNSASARLPLTSSDGVATPVKAHAEYSTGRGGSTTLTGSVVPNDVLQTNMFISRTAAASYAASTSARVRITDLPAGTQWKVDVLASAQGTGVRNQTIAIGSDTRVVDVMNNTGISATFDGVTPDSGEIAVAFTQVDAEQFAYLTAVILTRVG
ncbi:hypothetical protein [Aureimonas populi]|nr:hypothetical protein [Aureimonas populi]